MFRVFAIRKLNHHITDKLAGALGYQIGICAHSDLRKSWTFSVTSCVRENKKDGKFLKPYPTERVVFNIISGVGYFLFISGVLREKIVQQ